MKALREFITGCRYGLSDYHIPLFLPLKQIPQRICVKALRPLIWVCASGVSQLLPIVLGDNLHSSTGL